MMRKIAIVVHGGAGAWELGSKRLRVGRAACDEAAAAGHTVLKSGGSALDAVETAVRVLEDCPALDAGRGSYLNKLGEIEMDALIMDGQNLNMGAVAAIQRVQYPISLARRIMTLSPGAAVGGFVLYAALNGVTLSLIFLAYTGASIARVFFISAGTFAGVSLYAATIRRHVAGDHQPYGEVSGYYSKVPDAAHIDVPLWSAYLDGQLERAEAIDRIVAEAVRER